MSPALQLLLAWLVLQAAVTDLALRLIPNVLVLAGLGIALALHWHAGPPGVLLSTWLAGLATGLCLFLPLYLLRGMAAGDVKLMAMVGAFAGPEQALRIACATCLIGGVMAVGILLHNRRWRLLYCNLVTLSKPLAASLHGVPQAPVVIPRDASAGSMPYGVAIALGTVAVVVQPHL